MTSNEIARYQEEQSGMPPEQLKALQQFDSEGELSTPFGMELREAKRTLKSGEDADGLLITPSQKGSPAATVGLRPTVTLCTTRWPAAAMVGAVFLPAACRWSSYPRSTTCKSARATT